MTRLIERLQSQYLFTRVFGLLLAASMSLHSVSASAQESGEEEYAEFVIEDDSGSSVEELIEQRDEEARQMEIALGHVLA